jgi:hypothetical protein
VEKSFRAAPTVTLTVLTNSHVEGYFDANALLARSATLKLLRQGVRQHAKAPAFTDAASTLPAPAARTPLPDG